MLWNVEDLIVLNTLKFINVQDYSPLIEHSEIFAYVKPIITIIIIIMFVYFSKRFHSCLIISENTNALHIYCYPQYMSAKINVKYTHNIYRDKSKITHNTLFIEAWKDFQILLIYISDIVRFISLSINDVCIIA